MVSKLQKLAVSVVVAASGSALPAMAQESAEAKIEALVAASQTPEAALQLAHEQEAAGDLMSAASTLERTLIVNATADTVRLEYARLLCLLGDPELAQVQVAALGGRMVGKPGWDYMVSACGQGVAAAGSASRNSGITGQFTAGIAYEEDALGALNIFTNFFAPKAEDGLAYVMSGRVNGRTPAGSGFIYANARALLHQSISGPSSDYIFGELEAGYGHEGAKADFAIGPVIRHGRIEGDSYVTEYGGQAKVALHAGATAKVTLKAESVWQNYQTFGADGWHHDLSLAYSTRPKAGQSFYFGVAGEKKTADFRLQEYSAVRAMAAARLPLGENGTYTTLSSTVRIIDFRSLPFIPDRKETRFYNRVAVGTPVKERFVFVEAAVNHSYRNYNAASFLKDYSSWGGELRVICNF